MANNDPYEAVHRSGARRVTAEGDVWWVYEADAMDGRSLIFETAKIVRRVRAFPANWHDLSDEELSVVMREV